MNLESGESGGPAISVAQEQPPFLARSYPPTVYGDRILWESAIQVCARDFVRPGDDVLDVGANIGGLTVGFSRMVGPTGRVHSFEPNPFVLPRLRADVAANHADNVTVVAAAVWRVSGERLSFICEDSFYSAGSRIGTNVPGERCLPVEVESVTVDDHVRAHGLHPSLMKFDVEGVEGIAISGARATIAAHRPVVIFEFRPRRPGEVNPTALLAAEDYVMLDVNCYLALSEIDYGFADADTIVNLVAIPTEKRAASKYRAIARDTIFEHRGTARGNVVVPVSVPSPGRYLVAFEIVGDPGLVARASVTGARSGLHAAYEAALRYLLDGPKTCNCVIDLTEPEELRCAFESKSSPEGKLASLTIRRLRFAG